MCPIQAEALTSHNPQDFGHTRSPHLRNSGSSDRTCTYSLTRMKGVLSSLSYAAKLCFARPTGFEPVFSGLQPGASPRLLKAGKTQLLMAGVTGFAPATSGSTDRRSPD